MIKHLNRAQMQSYFGYMTCKGTCVAYMRPCIHVCLFRFCMFPHVLACGFCHYSTATCSLLSMCVSLFPFCMFSHVLACGFCHYSTATCSLLSLHVTVPVLYVFSCSGFWVLSLQYCYLLSAFYVCACSRSVCFPMFWLAGSCARVLLPALCWCLGAHDGTSCCWRSWPPPTLSG